MIACMYQHLGNKRFCITSELVTSLCYLWNIIAYNDLGSCKYDTSIFICLKCALSSDVNDLCLSAKDRILKILVLFSESLYFRPLHARNTFICLSLIYCCRKSDPRLFYRKKFPLLMLFPFASKWYIFSLLHTFTSTFEFPFFSPDNLQQINTSLFWKMQT